MRKSIHSVSILNSSFLQEWSLGSSHGWLQISWGASICESRRFAAILMVTALVTAARNSVAWELDDLLLDREPSVVALVRDRHDHNLHILQPVSRHIHCRDTFGIPFQVAMVLRCGNGQRSRMVLFSLLLPSRFLEWSALACRPSRTEIHAATDRAATPLACAPGYSISGSRRKGER